MNLELDTTAKALYLRLVPGRVADTVELADSVVVDLDETGDRIGIEFVHAEDFGPFLLDHPEAPALPARVTYVSLDRGTSWNVETGTEDRLAEERARANAEVNAAFVNELIANPSLLDRIPQDATLIPIRYGAPHLSPDDVIALAGRIAGEGGVPVIQPLGMPAPERPEWDGPRIPNIRYRELTPRWPADLGRTGPSLRYFRDTDLLVFDLLPGREAKPEYGRVIPLFDPELAGLLVDLETQDIIGRFIPRFLKSIAPNFPQTRAWIALASVRDTTPREFVGVLEELGLVTSAGEEPERRVKDDEPTKTTA